MGYFFLSSWKTSKSTDGSHMKYLRGSFWWPRIFFNNFDAYGRKLEGMMGAIWWRKQCCFRAGSSFLIWFVTLSEQDLETDFIPCHSIWKRKRSRISIDPNYFGDIFTRLSIAVRNYQISFLIQTYENSIVFHLTRFKKYQFRLEITSLRVRLLYHSAERA